MTDQKLLDLLALTKIEGVGDIVAKKLLSHFGNAEDIFKSKSNQLAMIDGIGSVLIRNLKNKLAFERAEIELKFIKQNRQLILVTHNPNIAVNANSDNVVHMNFVTGQIVVAGNDALQNKDIRLAVCNVMEGGRDALNKRYYRISKALKP